MTSFGGVSGERLRQYISRIEKLEEEKGDIADNIRDTYADAKSNGFDPKIMRQVIKLRKMDVQERQEQENVLDVYLHAMGMIPSFEKEDSAVVEAAAAVSDAEDVLENAESEAVA